MNSSTSRAKGCGVARMEYGPVQMQMAVTLAEVQRSQTQLGSRAHAAVTSSSGRFASSELLVVAQMEPGLVQMVPPELTLASL